MHFDNRIYIFISLSFFFVGLYLYFRFFFPPTSCIYFINFFLCRENFPLNLIEWWCVSSMSVSQVSFGPAR
ncbi:hypothetical protein BDZ91DRAFT_711650 [Kalaharituber pfeilii]|nr:hypothetical protein BDZ91DRAFT_711650 [Kalaharituber pfeilii]